MLPSLAKCNIKKGAALLLLLYKQGKHREKMIYSINATRTAAIQKEIEPKISVFSNS